VRVKLTGIASATKVLASGEKVTYYYAWRGGPGLKGEPDSPEFILSYEQAHRERHTPDSSVLKAIIADCLASKQFDGLRDRTKADYLKQIAKIERTFGDLPLAALEDPKVTKEFLRWRDRIGGRKQADYAFTVLMLVLAHGRKVGMTGYRPPGRIEKLYHADRSNKIWEDHNVAAFMAVAAEHLQWALIFAAETGQRQGDLLRLKWSAYDGHWIKLTPSKSITRRKPSGRPVEIPVSSRLQALIKKLPRLSPIMLTNGRGRPWQGNSFRKAWGSCINEGWHRGSHVPRSQGHGRHPHVGSRLLATGDRDLHRMVPERCTSNSRPLFGKNHQARCNCIGEMGKG
jgi:integrase